MESKRRPGRAPLLEQQNIVVGVSTSPEFAEKMRDAARQMRLRSVSEGWVQAAQMWLSQLEENTETVTQ
jgi:hypothetical protein